MPEVAAAVERELRVQLAAAYRLADKFGMSELIGPLAVGDKEMPGFGEQMRRISLEFVPTAILSRQVAVVRGLFAEYARFIDEPACFVGFERELEALPGDYRLLLAEAAAGCVAVRLLDPKTAEMKRLCEVYEASDEEGRRLIRLFAELSVSGVLQIPPRS